jgi:hypothetical protein
MEIDQIRKRAFTMAHANGSDRIYELGCYYPQDPVMKGVMGGARSTVTFFPYAGRW